MRGRPVPIIETERLRLRPFRAEDLDSHAKTMGDSEVVRHLGGTPFSREDSWRRMLSAQGLWSLLGFGYWAVERKEEGDQIGQVGFSDFKRDMVPPIDGLPEMGWIFAPHAQGKGYAVEAVRAGLEWADKTLEADIIPAIIDPANTASIRVAERTGFDEREMATYHGKPILLFRRRRGV